MSTKHTPGPWFVVEDGRNGKWPGGCEIAIDDREGGNEERDYFLASVVHGDPDELLANARLVAAAPALLVACKAAFKLLDSVAFVAKDGDTTVPLSLLRAAIARATGARQ